MGWGVPVVQMARHNRIFSHWQGHSVATEYLPVISGYCLVVAAYYAIMTVANVATLSGFERQVLVSASSGGCLGALAVWYRLRRPVGERMLEALVSLVNVLILTNVLVALAVEYHPAKLVYFIMMAMIFAFASVSLRQALVSIGIALAFLFGVLEIRAPDQLEIYGFVGFAAALSAVAIAYYLRRVIGLAVTARRDAEQRLATAEGLGLKMREQSLSDSLTGLPNRRAFFERLEASKNAAAAGGDHWLLLLDLDGFKGVNDNYGHIIGDALLQEVAARLTRYCGELASASRMGGDEFNIILELEGSEPEVESWCEGLLALLSETYVIEDRMIRISASIGAHRLSADASDTSLIRNADYALLRAKRDGKNRVIVFRPEHAADAEERFRIEQSLRVADFAREIDLLFQPQYDLAQQRIVSVEALARWTSPSSGKIGPNKFIEAAEDTGLVSRITLAVLAKALERLSAWEDPVPVAINLSGHDLMADQLIDQLIELVQQSGVSPSLVEFEVTETAMMPDTARASANLHRLANLGHSISLDDFGTGYSNFSYLRSLPISKLKIDRAFIEDLGDPMTEKILHSLVGMARTLGVRCLLEGIENELQMVVAKRVGVQSVQGFLIGKPMNNDQLQQLIAQSAQAEDASGTGGSGSDLARSA